MKYLLVMLLFIYGKLYFYNSLDFGLVEFETNVKRIKYSKADFTEASTSQFKYKIFAL